MTAESGSPIASISASWVPWREPHCRKIGGATLHVEWQPTVVACARLETHGGLNGHRRRLLRVSQAYPSHEARAQSQAPLAPRARGCESPVSALSLLAWAEEKAVVVSHPPSTSSARPIAVYWVSSRASSAGATTYMPPLAIASRTSSSTLVPWARDCARTTRAACSFSNAKPMALTSAIDFLG